MTAVDTNRGVDIREKPCRRVARRCAELTPRPEAAARVRALALQAEREYLRRGQQPPPHVESATRAGLEDSDQEEMAPCCLDFLSR